jgi:pimeloyl-ACP methyl ester carboxylesterase
MRRYPAGIRSVVLDAVYPPDVDLYTAAPANFERALDRLFEGCAANAVCAKTYPDLQETFFETVKRLNANPLPATLTDFENGEEIPTIMDGDALIATTFQLLYDTEAKLLVPELILDASQNDLAALENVRSNLIAQPTVASQGMMLSVQCHEELPFSSLTLSTTVQSRYPEIGGVFAHGLLGGLTARVCAGWDAGQAAPSANEPVHSNLPTLIMTGEFDPVTPPAWGERVAQTLSRSHAFEYPGVGHGASFVQGCPQQMFLAFLDDPTGMPDATCITAMQP